MKNKYLSLLMLLIPLCLTVNCNSVNPKPEKSVKEKIQNTWTAIEVKHNNSIVYKEGIASNSIAGYANFRLDLSNPSITQLTEFEGSTFNGQWELNSVNTILVLKNLTPVPSGTNGSIEYSIDKIEEGMLELTKTTTSPKTGNSTVSYILKSM